MIRFRILAGVLVSTCILSACAPSARTNTYLNPNFEAGSVNSLAVLPIRNARLAPSEAQEVNRRLAQTFASQRPSIRLVSPTEATDVLNEKGLVEAYSDFVRDFASSGIPNAATLRDLGTALGVQALVQGELISIDQQDGLFGVRTGTTRVVMRLMMLDTDRGEILWEATAEGVSRTATTLQAAPPVFEALNVALDQLLAEVPPI